MTYTRTRPDGTTREATYSSVTVPALAVLCPNTNIRLRVDDLARVRWDRGEEADVLACPSCGGEHGLDCSTRGVVKRRLPFD